MIPTGRLVALSCLPVLLGGAAVAYPVFIAPMIAVDLVLAIVAVFDLLASGARLSVAREVVTVQAAGRAFSVGLRVDNQTGRALRIRLVDDPPGGPPEATIGGLLARGASERFTYDLTLRDRGAHVFGPITVRWRSRLGLFERQRRFAIPDTVKVYPTFRQLRSWGVLAREDERRAPVRVRRKPGGESEFERLRPYVRGDSHRHVDWRATARRRSLVTREFGQESDQNVLFLIDSGRMMSAEWRGRSAFDHALEAALLLGQVALRHGDRVGLLTYDRAIQCWQPPRGGARAGVRLVRASYDLRASLDEPDHALALRWVSQRVRRRSLIILLTSVIDPANAAATEAVVRIVGRRHLPLCVWLRDAGLDALVDAPRPDRGAHFVAGAAAELLAERARQLRSLERRGAMVLDAHPDRLTPGLLASYLEVKARRLL